jgi:hypothetical protein
MLIVLACCVFLYESTGFAEAIEKTIKVTMNSIKLVVNGKSVESDNFIYDGTTYVPLRQVTEMLGKQVLWDDATRTVKIDGGLAETSTRYVGETKRDGNGTYTWPNGDNYVGEWKQGEMAGQGTLVYAGGEQYTGAFLHNMRNGKGKIVWKNKDIYDGEWLNDWMSGLGTYTFANGDTYTGAWQNGKMNGFGTYTFQSGITWQGRWDNNQFMGNMGQE